MLTPAPVVQEVMQGCVAERGMPTPAVVERFDAVDGIAVHEGNEIVCPIATTTDSTHDSTPADRLIEQVPAQTVYADAAYCDTSWRKRLRGQGIFPRICFNSRNDELKVLRNP